MVSSLVSRCSTASSPTYGSQVFYPGVIASRGCKPDEESRRIWEATAWTDVSHFIAAARPDPELWRTNMGEVIQFVPRAELERRRLNREGRARNSNILPPVASVSEPRDQKSELADS
jgi:hypothetical protein